MSGECDCCGEHTLECVCKMLREARGDAARELQVEFGSAYPIGVWEGILHDSEGKKIEVPFCEKCGSFKNMMIGREAYQWVCSCG